MHPLLEKATNPDGSRRFFPAGGHPATHRYRQHLAALSQLRERTLEELAAYINSGQIGMTLTVLPNGDVVSKPDPYLERAHANLANIDLHMAYIKQELANFEGTESIAKADYLSRFRG